MKKIFLSLLLCLIVILFGVSFTKYGIVYKYGIIELAKTTNISAFCSILPSKDKHYSNPGDVIVSEPYVKDRCYYEVATDNINFPACEKMTGADKNYYYDKGICYHSVALESGDVLNCEKVSSPSMRAGCYEFYKKRASIAQ